MRTTITFEPDVQVLIRTAMKERGISFFKDALNATVRAAQLQIVRDESEEPVATS